MKLEIITMSFDLPNTASIMVFSEVLFGKTSLIETNHVGTSQ